MEDPRKLSVVKVIEVNGINVWFTPGINNVWQIQVHTCTRISTHVQIHLEKYMQGLDKVMKTT